VVSLLSLAVICFGVRYAVGREQLRRPEYLHSLYQETNKDFFGDQLPDVVVEVEDLSDAKPEGETHKETEDLFVIVLDPNWNTSDYEALHTYLPHGLRYAEPLSAFANPPWSFLLKCGFVWNKVTIFTD
jgi:hypothetical protein